MKMYLLIYILLASISAKTLEKGALAKAPELSELEKTFLDAAPSGDLLLFSKCLAKGVDCNVVLNHEGNTALHQICVLGRYRFLPLILNAPAIDVNKIDKKGNSALHYAATYNHDSPISHMLLFAWLIKKGANVNAKNNASETPLSELLTTTGHPAELCELLIDHGADISLTVPVPNPLNPSTPIVTETIFERAIRCNNPLHLIAFLKSPKGITKPIILKALVLTKFGHNNGKWGNNIGPKALAEDHLKSNFITMGRMLIRYYFTMQKIGFGIEDKGADWQRNPHSIPIPIDLAKKIAWHSAKDTSFTQFEKSCLTILFEKKEIRTC